MAKKVLQIPADESLIGKINKAQKELKLKTQTECVRTLLSYILENNIGELKTRIEKSRISALLQEAQQAEEVARNKRETLEKQLEKVEA